MPQGVDACAEVSGRCDAHAWFFDADNDGFGGHDMRMACDPGPGYASQAGDCDDTHQSINPGMPEITGNGIDDNCDGVSL